VITFHSYNAKEEITKQINEFKKHNRPVICTEWLHRPRKSTVEDILPLLYAENVGSLIWGFVNGPTQTDLTWGHRPKDLPYTGLWQHNLLNPDLTPYDECETDLIKSINLRKPLKQGQ